MLQKTHKHILSIVLFNLISVKLEDAFFSDPEIKFSLVYESSAVVCQKLCTW